MSDVDEAVGIPIRDRDPVDEDCAAQERGIATKSDLLAIVLGRARPCVGESPISLLVKSPMSCAYQLSQVY